MSRTKVLSCFAGAALSVAALPVLAQSTDADRAYQAELNADAQARSSNLADKGRGGFSISDGGSGKLNISGYTQFRYVMNWRDNPGDGNPHDSGFTNGFETARTRLQFWGTVLNPNLNFKIEGAFDNADGGDSNGTFNLTDAWGLYRMDNGLAIGWGQFKAPVIREWNVDATKQLAADYSVTNDYFKPGYTQGVWLDYRSDAFRGVFAIDDGANSANTSYYSPSEADVGLTTRLEGKLAGDWDRFDDFTSFRSDNGFAAMIGGGLHWQHMGDTAHPGSGAVPQTDFFLYSLDASLEGAGWNVFGAFIGNHNEPNDGGGDSSDEFGAVIQGGFFVADQTEIFGRWDAIFPDSDAPSGQDDNFNTITFGVNHYYIPDSHAAKMTVDLQWFVDSTTSNALASGLTGSDATNLLASTEDNQIAIRIQFQLMF